MIYYLYCNVNYVLQFVIQVTQSLQMRKRQTNMQSVEIGLQLGCESRCKARWDIVSDLEDLTQDFTAWLVAYDGEEFTKRLQEHTVL